eukprot:8973219-Alexandrium_andersonii.AAC.1
MEFADLAGTARRPKRAWLLGLRVRCAWRSSRTWREQRGDRSALGYLGCAREVPGGVRGLGGHSEATEARLVTWAARA